MQAGMKDFDWTMFFVTMIICGLGVLQIFSATHDTIWQGSWWKQLMFIVAGVALMWVVANIDYHALIRRVYPLYIASVVLLVAVLVIGKRAFGSTRWIALPAGIHLQISEFAKIASVNGRRKLDVRPSCTRQASSSPSCQMALSDLGPRTGFETICARRSKRACPPTPPWRR